MIFCVDKLMVYVRNRIVRIGLLNFSSGVFFNAISLIIFESKSLCEIIKIILKNLRYDQSFYNHCLPITHVLNVSQYSEYSLQ